MDNYLVMEPERFKSLIEFLPQVISSIIVIIAATAIRIVIRKLVNSYSIMHSRFDLRTTHMNRIINFSVNTLSIIVLIVIWGVDTKNIFLTLSSVFAVIGVALFAQWSVLSNITAGIILFFSSAFRIGNYIKILDKDMPVEAKIEDIFTFYTHLRTKEGELHIFPNNLLLQKAIQIIEDPAETENPV
jgi:small-conductance mechanosensitive channel